MRVKETKVYQFDELSDEAKERARQWWREGAATDSDWHESVYEVAATAAEYLGLDIRTRRVNLMGGGTRLNPCIYYSGFNSQGDGACYEGQWCAADMNADALKKAFPKDAELHRIADALAIIASNYPDASASTKHSGHYYHSGCMDIDTDSGVDRYSDEPGAEELDDAFPDEDLRQLLRDFADWIYAALEREYEYQNADEQVDENIRANEYEFDEEGNIV